MNYIALNGWIYCGFGGEKKPREFIDWAAAQGLDGVELTVGDCLAIDTTEDDAKSLAAYAKEKGVGLRSLATGAGWGKWLCADDPAERAEAIAFVKKYLQLAAWLGAETVLVVPGATRALENVWNRFLISPMEWKLFLDQFESTRVGIYFDAANCCLNCRPEDFPEILGDRIKAVHLKNFAESDSAGGLHGFGEDLFAGVVDFKNLFAAFAKIGYAGPYTVEMIPFSRLPDLVMPDAALAEKMVAQIKELKKYF